MPVDDSASQNTLDSTLYVSSIDVSLARDSEKTIGSIGLKKNDESLKEIQKTICAGGVHREEFNPPLAVEPDDRIFVSVNCYSRMQKRVNVPIEIHLRDIECMRDEQGARSYRKKTRKIEVIVVGQELSVQLPATTTSVVNACSQFRLLIIGNSGVGKHSLIRSMFGVEDFDTLEGSHGMADIDQEFFSPTNERFVVHDSLGFEAGDNKNMDKVKDFVTRRKAMPRLKDQLHAIWLCLETPYSGGRLLEGGAEEFLQRRNEILGDVPLVVVLTKVDRLDAQLELDLPEEETLEQFRSKYLDKHCVQPLHQAAGSDITHVTVSVEEGYSDSLAGLFKVTDENMAKYHADEAPRVVATIAQRVSIKEKIESSTAVGKKKYCKMLLKSAVFRGHTLKECLQVIRKDIITVWNFNDPDMCLMDDKIIEDLLRFDNVGDALDAPSTTISFAGSLASAFERLKGLVGSGEVRSAVVRPIARTTLSLLPIYATYHEAKKDVKVLMAFIVDLVCVMQIVFLVTSGGRVTPQTVAFALKAYETPGKRVHQMVEAFDGKLGVRPGGRDRVLEKVEALIWCHSIADHEIEELRRKIGDVLAHDDK